MSYIVKSFFDEKTYTLTYIVYDDETLDAVIIDPVLNYDQATSKINFQSINNLDSFVVENKLSVHYVLETHAHADHLSGAVELKKRFPQLMIAIGKDITKIQETFSNIFNLRDLKTDGVQFDLLLEDDSIFVAGSIKIKTISTPGHTPACVSYLIGDHLFTGDALFMPDYGTGRCDFPMGSAKELYHSVHEKIYKLPEQIKYYTGHDYQPNGRALRYQSTIGESKKTNIQLKESTTTKEFVDFRNARDATLSAPTLLLPSIQINIDGGKLPLTEDNGISYIKIPLTY
jgi:glyoxylase-like metal-dependent hydrolase (beta-lactamase superfamily II)